MQALETKFQVTCGLLFVYWPNGVGNSAARPTLPSQTMEARAAEAIFLLCLLKKPVYPHPSTTGSRYCDNPEADFFFFSCLIFTISTNLYNLISTEAPFNLYYFVGDSPIKVRCII